MDDFDEKIRIHEARVSSARRLTPALVLVAASGLWAPRLLASISASLVPSQPSPAPVGTMITWTAQASGGADSDAFWYRFRVRALDGDFRVIRDYGPLSSLNWTSIDEGAYEIEVSVRDLTTEQVSDVSVAFTFDSRIQNGQDTVSPTSHPLVFLFSTSRCSRWQARVQFQAAGGAVGFTPAKPCSFGRSLNFYLAGLAANTAYSASLRIEEGRESTVGPSVPFQTGTVGLSLSTLSVVQAPGSSDQQGILLQAPLYLPATAMDLNGNVLWYGPSDLTYLTHTGPDGTFFGLLESGIDPQHDVVRRFDLVGMTVQETNVARVNEQLAALGKRAISGFHHDARTLSDGKIVLLGDVEQLLTDVQGPGTVDVIGDMILVLDEDLQVVWTWDTFDHLDVTRAAVLGETCALDPGCAPHYLATNANDWTHGNAVGETADGNLIYSSRHQDWVIKVDYEQGQGSGDVVWRLGKDGDFTYDSTDPYPWFSHQHDPDYEPGSASVITLFDNGNTRLSVMPGGSSRGQAIQVDEHNRVVHAIVSLDLGVVSAALGAAQHLEDGTYHFDAGLIADPQGFLDARALSIQINGAAQVLSSVSWLTPVYRSFRLTDLYGASSTQPVNPAPRLVAFR